MTNETPREKYERTVKEFDKAWDDHDQSNFSTETGIKVREAYAAKLKAHSELRKGPNIDVV